MGGLIFGVSAIYSNEYNNNLFANACHDTCPRDGTSCCADQLARLTLVSSVGFFVADGAAAPWGEVVDRGGPRVSLAAAACVSVVGLFMLSASAYIDETVLDSPDYWKFGQQGSNAADVLATLGLILVGGAGPGIFNGVYVGCLNLKDTTRSIFYEATLATLVAGCFDASSLVFNLFSAATGFIALGTGFLIWGFWCMFLVTVTLFYAIREVESPDGSTAPSAPTEASALIDAEKAKPSDTATPAYGSLLSTLSGRLLGGSKEGAAEMKTATESKEATLLPTASDASARQCCGPDGTAMVCAREAWAAVGTWHNLLLVLTMGFLNLACSHYITAHQAYLSLTYGTGVAAEVSDLFDVLFPILGFCAALGVSPLLTAEAQWLPFAVLCAIANTWIVLTIIPTITTQYIAVVIFGPMRTLQWASFYRIVGANVELYDPSSVGRTLGYNGLLIAIIGDALAPVLMSFAQASSGPADEENRYMIVKIVLLCILGPISASLPIYLRRISAKPPVTAVA